MKKFTLSLMTAFMLFLFSPTQLKADTEPAKLSVATTETTTVTTATATKAAEANAMVVRLNEIKAMDMSTLSSSEKKELRKEVRNIKKGLKTNSESTYIEGSNGGIYVSVGAAILIVLLLILLL